MMGWQIAYRTIKLLLIAVLCTFAGACRSRTFSNGASAEGPPLPKADEVVEIRFVPPKGAPDPKWPEATLTKAEAIRDVVEWLRAVDWSAQPRDMAVMDMPPMATLHFVKRDGTKQSFMIGDSCIAYGQGLWHADTERLKVLLKR